MDLGQKIKSARLEAGLSQRQLCAGEITRNMLSLIENGAAQPSMKTLQFLAGQLGKSVSYFLEEDGQASPNQQCLFSARAAFAAGSFREAAAVLAQYQGPDPVFDPEKEMLWAELCLQNAELALREGKALYAQTWLEQVPDPLPYFQEEVRRRRLLLLGRLPGQSVSQALPSLDRELTLRAREALAAQDPGRAGALLDAVEHPDPGWHLLRGQCHLAQKDYRSAAWHLHKAEQAYPRETAPALEAAYRELGDFRRAYEYAVKARP